MYLANGRQDMVHRVGGRVHDDAAVEDEQCRWRGTWDAAKMVIEDDVACSATVVSSEGRAARCACLGSRKWLMEGAWEDKDFHGDLVSVQMSLRRKSAMSGVTSLWLHTKQSQK